jgi:hypothetical protein
MLYLAALITLLATDALHHEEFLPPEIPWEGASIELMVDPGDDWVTGFEASGGTNSPDYEGTRRWFERLVEASDDLEFVSLGQSPEQRDIFAIVASEERAFTTRALRESDRPLVFAHSGIHSGEIDGKDAGMMLLRDMTVRGTKTDLLEQVNFVFVPIFSVDGHERSGIHNRMNQRGPKMQGWRTTARNLNLNRDYAKADAVEMQHMLRFLHAIDPDLYLDLHVTDGADYAYDITYGATGPHGWSPAIGAWILEKLTPHVDAQLEDMGHIPGPLIFTVDRLDIKKGMYEWTAGPRFSNGYGDARHIPTILLENHSLKPYRQRVLGTYVFLEGCLRAVAADIDRLRGAIAVDRHRRDPQLHLAYERGEPGEIEFLSIGEVPFESPITGATVMQWNAEVVPVTIPVINNRTRANFVDRPVAYWIPAAWADLGQLLDLHAIHYERVDAPTTLDVEMTRLPEARLEATPFEGRARVATGASTTERTTATFGAGALRVPTDQPGGTLAMLLLEPQADDSFFQWGMMLEVMQRTEYFEAYVFEPMAREMLDADAELTREFEERLASDEEFAGNARARLEFFYERTPYFDREYRVYPIMRETN